MGKSKNRMANAILFFVAENDRLRYRDKRKNAIFLRLLFFVMEYLEGKTILDVLKEKADGKYTVEETIPIITAVLDALSIVHQEGILHRDISPDNIFLTTDGKVKLIDFGAARYATSPRSL